MNPQIQLMLQQAIQAFQGQNFDRADSILSKVVKLAPQNLAALHILGLIKASQEKFKEAADLLSKAARINPNDPSIQYNLAKALSDSGLNEESIVHHKKAVDLAPNNLDAWMNYGRALSKLAQHEDSLMCFDRVIAVNPNYSEAFLNKGIAHKALKHYPDAMASFDKAINLSPDLYGAWINKGSILYQFKYLEEALNSFDRAISLKPDSFEAYVSRSSILHALKHFDEALLACGKAISLQPDNALAYFNNGVMLRELGRLEEAKISFAKALEINPDYVNARWEIPFLTIPNIFPKEENLHALRESFASELEGLDKWLTVEKLNEAYEAVGATQPFYLAYQELNNKELLSKYGNICNRVMAHWQNLNKLKISENKESGKIKVGIVSDHIRNHSVWNAIIKGWVLNLDADKIEVHIFHLGNIVDEETHLAESIATSFTSMPDTLLVWGSIIIEKNIEVLIYPEIGMHQLTTQLANLRLAPVQIAAWGHPETSGLPNIDYYLSADLFESPDSSSGYSENLITLPNLGCTYSPLPIISTEPNILKWGIDTSIPILLCPGSPFKYAPQNDWMLVEIVKRIGQCKLVFFNQQDSWTKILRERLEKVFHKSNLALEDYVIFISWLDSQEFYGLMKCSTVYLDTIGFSGFNTAMQAVDCALPIVSLEGKFMRGRLGSGILRQMGVTELIANTDEEYIALVTRLAQDKPYREQIRKKIIENRNILYDDIAPIRALESFLLAACRGS